MNRALLLTSLLCASAIAFSAPPPAISDKARSIFDGKTLDGWDFDPKIWRVEDGMITGGSTTEKIRENHFICTRKSYQNFELNLKIKVSGDPATGMLNSGIQIRSVRVPGGAHMSGYQIDCGKGWFGKIYDEFRRNRVIAEPVDAAALEKAVDVYGWNHYRIRAEGPRIRTWINGVLAIDYTEQDRNIALDGLIGPQVHSGGVCLVQVKDVTIEELPATPGAPTWESLGGVEAARKLVAPPPKPKPKQAPDPNAAKPKRDTSYNNVEGTPRSAREQQKLFRLPPGYEIELVVQESEGLGKFVSVYFDQRGRLWTQTALEYPVDANENPAAAEALYAGKGKDKVLVYPRESVNAPIPAGGLTRPTVFADGLAIPLGILPWGNGDTCYIQHGHDLKLFKDTDGDGKADTHEVILTGFGVQDSHLFPHQFTRAPGGWIWMAQGLFNNSKVHKPGSNQVVDWAKCSMARMRPDGSQFEVTSTGPNNIWGLVITGEGEAFIQEANDYGYPVMPFHEYAYYPGGMEALKKSYQPDFPPTAEFRMGGTGLSGLALGEGGFRKLAPALKPDGLCMFVANPIISKVQTLAMHRDGPRWKLEQAADLVTCDDPFFRPVALTQGPDGCLYIVDWYNKIISHNEVPRNHPDRDKTRGRIWRVKHKQQPLEKMPDMTRCAPEELIAKLGDNNLTQSHLAWQAIVDRKLSNLAPKLKEIIADTKTKTAARVQAIWAMEGIGLISLVQPKNLFGDESRNIRREAISSLGSSMPGRTPRNVGVTAETPPELREAIENSKRSGMMDAKLNAIRLSRDLAGLSSDPDPEVRAELIRRLDALCTTKAIPADMHLIATLPNPFSLLVGMAHASLDSPVAPSTRNGKPIKIAEAYDREFERHLIRRSLERHPDAVEAFLKTPEAEKLPLENRLLATLSLPPKTSAPLVAKLLGQLQRPPNDEEILRLAEGLGDSAVNEALSAALRKVGSRENIAAALLRLRTKLDANKLAPLLQTTAKELLDGSAASQDLALQLAGEFQFTELETPIVALLKSWLGDQVNTPRITAALRALGLMGSRQSELFAKLVSTEKDPLIRNEAISTLASSKAGDAGSRVLALWKELDSAGRRLAMDRLCTTKPGARAVVAALKAKTLKAEDMDASGLDRLQAVLGPKDAELAGVMNDLAALFRPVLRLDGSKEDYVETGVTLDGPFTVETWVKLDGPNIGNTDGILGSPGRLDMNFFGSQFRVWVGGTTHDAIIAKKKMAPDNWTHIAVTRDVKGMFQIFVDGELDQSGGKPAPHKMENVRIGWTGPRGARGMFSEFRIWNRVRTPQEIRDNFDRGIDDKSKADGLIFHGSGDKWPRLHGKARITKTSDLPPLLTSDEAKALDAKFARFRELTQRPGGDPAKGRLIAALCMGCHLIQGQGGNLAPNISGAATMGIEGLLRNLITPNAAMEAGYRTYRVELKTGDIVDAFFVSEDKDAVVVRMPGLPDRRIPKAEVRGTKFIRRSLMPEGMLDALQPEMVTDLFAYLMSLKG